METGIQTPRMAILPHRQIAAPLVIPEGRETRKRSDYVSHLSGISCLERAVAKMKSPLSDESGRLAI